MSTPSSALSLPRRLLDAVRYRICALHCSLRTEEACVHWVRAFVRVHGRRHPRELDGTHVEAFLTWLSAERRVSVSTHRQALSAVLFLYRQVPGVRLPWMESIGRPPRKPRLPVVLSRQEGSAVPARLPADGVHRLLAERLYGTGRRITEALQRRVKDVDFAHRVTVVRCGKGAKDRGVMLPSSPADRLRMQLRASRAVWEGDRGAGRGGVWMPDALDRKYPRAGGESGAWFWVFPQADLSICPRTGVERRHHLFDPTFQRACKRACKRAVTAAGIERPATPHTRRHRVVTHLLQAGTDIRTVPSLLGPADVSTTMVHTHVPAHGAGAVRSPLDGRVAPSVPPAAAMSEPCPAH